MTTKMPLWKDLIDRIKKAIVEALVFLSTNASKRPWTTVAISTVVATLSLLLGVLLGLSMENDGRILWTPTDSVSLLHENWLNSPESGFSLEGRHIQVLVHKNGDNMLFQDAIRHIFAIQDILVATPGYKGICETTESGEASSCDFQSPSLFWENIDSFEAAVQTDQDLIRQMSFLTYPNDELVHRSNIFGHALPALSPDVDPRQPYNVSDVMLESVEGLMVTLKLPVDAPGAPAYETTATKRLLTLRQELIRADNPSIRLELMTHRSFDDELTRAISGDIPYVALAYIMMGVFCAFTLFKKHPVQSQTMLGAGAVLTIVLSLMTGYGCIMFCGVPFTYMMQIFPYVLVGIGLDDTYILMGAFTRTASTDGMEQRVQQIMEEVGVSITVSTVTTFLAFLLGAFSSLPGIRYFAFYAAPTILIDFFYQVTFFVALLAIDCRRQAQGRRDCCPCFRVRLEDDKEVSETQDGSDADDEETGDDMLAVSVPNQTIQVQDMSETTPSANVQKDGHHTVAMLTSLPESLGHRIVKHAIDFMLRPATKVGVIGMFVLLFVVGTILASRVENDFDYRDLVPPDSFVRSYQDALNRFFDPARANQALTSHCYFRNIDVSKPEIQVAMLNFVDDMSELDIVAGRPSSFWLADFQEFWGAGAETMENSTNFYTALDNFLSTEPFQTQYSHDIVRDGSNRVVASRVKFDFVGIDVTENSNQVSALKKLKQTAASQPLNRGVSPKDWPLFSYGLVFSSWELYAVIGREVIQGALLGLLAVFVVALVFLPNPVGAFFVAPVVFMVYVELIGLLHLAGIAINTTTCVGLTMSIGLVVDYIMHVVHTFFETQGPSRNERVKQVMNTMGKSVLLGGMSTLLGVLPLAFSESEVFRTFFYTYLGIVLFGASHGLILTPVILSLVGPAQMNNEESHTVPGAGTTKHTSSPTNDHSSMTFDEESSSGGTSGMEIYR